jgi:hypothetical protein
VHNSSCDHPIVNVHMVVAQRVSSSLDLVQAQSDRLRAHYIVTNDKDAVAASVFFCYSFKPCSVSAFDHAKQQGP